MSERGSTKDDGEEERAEGDVHAECMIHASMKTSH